MKPVIGLPPVELGGDQETPADPLPAVALAARGGVGALTVAAPAAAPATALASTPSPLSVATASKVALNALTVVDAA